MNQKRIKPNLLFFGLIFCINILHLSTSYGVIMCSSILSDAPSETAGEPTGQLTLLRKSGRSQPGGIYKDEKGVEWYLKADVLHPELQTSAEVISSEIYRHFGYLTPETYIVMVDGRRYSASLYSRHGTEFNFKTDVPDTVQFRAMRIVAAFLKDWDRAIGGNNLLQPDGKVLLLDFGGTLGARARGEHKPGEIFSPAVGSFQALDPSIFYTRKAVQYSPNGDFMGAHPMKELFDSFDVSTLPDTHPWRRMMAADARPTIELFRTLDTEKIEKIVDKARFSSSRDRFQMIESLMVRRDAFLEYLEGYLGGTTYRSDSYWGVKSPIEDLSFSVRENRSPRITTDVQDFVNRIQAPSNEIIFFRGQAEFTEAIYSPGYQGGPSQPAGPPPFELRPKILDGYLHAAYRDLNPHRREQRSYRFTGSLGDIPFWDKATAFDLLAERHSISNGLPIFVSVSRRLDVATRWIKDQRFSTLYRYVYILAAPRNVAFPISRVLKQKKSKSNDEAEWVIPFDATPYVKGVYDTIEHKFIAWPLANR